MVLKDSPETAPSDSANDRLQQHAAILEAWLSRRSRIPSRWLDDAFGRMIDLVRVHLRPIQQQHLLASSYGREHFQVLAVGRQPQATVLLSRNATEVAYALRWLELTHSVSFGPWLAVVTQDKGAYLEAH